LLKVLAAATSVFLVAVVVLFVAIHAGMAGPDPLLPTERGTTVFDGVVLVEPGVARREHQRLVIESGRIAAVSDSSGGDASWAGAYVLPGLVDAHVHFPPAFIPGQTELFSFLYLLHGITGVRSLGDVGEGTSDNARARAADLEFAAPRIATCGRFVDGVPPLWANAAVVARPEDARGMVDALADQGYDCIKVYNQLDAASLAAVREAAHDRGLPVVGHVPFRVRHEDAHLDDPQHMLGFYPLEGPPRMPEDQRGWLTVDETRVASILQAVLADGAAMTPTLVAADRIGRGRALLADDADPVNTLLPPWYRHALWSLDVGMNPARNMAPDDVGMVLAATAAKGEVARRLHAAGVPLRAGTDTLAPMVVPGAALHEELRLLAGAGIPPEDVMAIATRGSAGVFGVEDLGTLRPGAPADLAIFREDPTRDLAALDSLMAVVVDGRVYTREMLEAQLDRYRRDFDHPLSRNVATPAMRALLGFALRAVVGVGPGVPEDGPPQPRGGDRG